MDLSGYLLAPSVALSAWLQLLRDQLAAPRGIFWWPTLATALAGVLLVTLIRRNRRREETTTTRLRYTDFVRELPVDVLCFLAYTFCLVLLGPLLLKATIAGASLVFLLAGVPPARTDVTGMQEQLIVAALIFICSDFMLYWSHRLFHAFAPLWRLHRLHHRPAVLTPLTAFRFWPPESVVHFIAFSLGSGLAIGISAKILGIGVAPSTYAGLNVFLLAWYLAFSHLRHSHVPLRFPRWLSYVLASPHMHQAHHSIEARHHHRNYATALALWDWMFGTLLIPDAKEGFDFGVAPAAPTGRAKATQA